MNFPTTVVEQLEGFSSDLGAVLMLFRSHTGSQLVKTTLANIMVELEGASIRSISTLMVERESLGCLVEVVVLLIN